MDKYFARIWMRLVYELKALIEMCLDIDMFQVLHYDLFVGEIIVVLSCIEVWNV